MEISDIPGPPELGGVSDANGVLTLNWTHNFLPPAQYFGFAWDIYDRAFVGGGLDGSVFFQYPLGNASGQIPLIFSGAYHAWISAQYFDGSLEITTNPWTGIAFSGLPHAPIDAWAENLGGRKVRLHWRPDIFGTWHYQLIVYKTAAAAFVPTDGPSGSSSLWHILDFGGQAFSPDDASFFNGTADFQFDEDGQYIIFIRGAGWLQPFPLGEFAITQINARP